MQVLAAASAPHEAQPGKCSFVYSDPLRALSIRASATPLQGGMGVTAPAILKDPVPPTQRGVAS